MIKTLTFTAIVATALVGTAANAQWRRVTTIICSTTGGEYYCPIVEDQELNIGSGGTPINHVWADTYWEPGAPAPYALACWRSYYYANYWSCGASATASAQGWNSLTPSVSAWTSDGGYDYPFVIVNAGGSQYTALSGIAFSH